MRAWRGNQPRRGRETEARANDALGDESLGCILTLCLAVLSRVGKSPRRGSRRTGQVRRLALAGPPAGTLSTYVRQLPALFLLGLNETETCSSHAHLPGALRALLTREAAGRPCARACRESMATEGLQSSVHSMLQDFSCRSPAL